jgi:cell division transport system ATP-binding protein
VWPQFEQRTIRPGLARSVELTVQRVAQEGQFNIIAFLPDFGCLTYTNRKTGRQEIRVDFLHNRLKPADFSCPLARAGENRGGTWRDMLTFDNVGMRYGTGPEVLRDVSFHLAPGSFHFLTGASGAGKTTLLRLMYLAQKPTRGTFSLFGRDVVTLARAERPDLRRRIGVVFQDFRLLDHLTALENVALPLRIAGHSSAEIDAHVAELLSWVGLKQQVNARPAQLSGGQQQRVAIARAVIARPDLLLADEPTGNVDDRIAVRLLHLFEEMNKVGTTIVFATHNQQLISRFPHPVLHVEQGEVHLLPPGSNPFGAEMSGGAP